MKAVPYSVFLEVTGRCNQRCRHCRWGEPRPAGKELPAGVLLRLLEELADLGTSQIVLTGGEPTIRRDLHLLVGRASALGQKCLLATNGSLLDPELAAKLSDAGLGTVQISLDGSTPEIHDCFRGAPGAFDAALDAIELCLSSGFAVQASMTVTAHNAKDIARVADLCRTLGVPVLKLRRLIASGAAELHAGSLDVSTAELRDICGNWITGGDRQGIGPRIEMEQAPFLVTSSGASELEPLDGRIRGGCSAGVALCVVDPVGNVRPCPSIGINVGNILDRRFSDVWGDSDVLQSLRDRGNLGGKCGACEYRQHCGGCRGDAHARTGDLFAEDPKCWYAGMVDSPDRRVLCSIG